MQVSMIAPKGAEVDVPSGGTPTAEAPSADGGFAAMLSALLVQMRESGTLVAAEPPDNESVEPVDAATEPKDESPDAPPEAEAEEDLALATALASAALTPPTPATASNTSSDVATADASADGEVAPAAPTAAVVATQPVAPAPAETTVTVEAPTAPSPTQDVATQADTAEPAPAATPLPDQAAPLSPTRESRATYAVVPSPAREAAQPQPVQPSEPQPVPAMASTAATLTPTSTTVEAPASPQAVLASANLAPARPAATRPPTEAAPASTASVDDVDVEVDDAMPVAAVHSAKAKAVDAETPEAVQPAPPPERGPVLEKHTMILARNALNEQLKGSSARELLASAREGEPRPEKGTETPATVFAVHDPARQLPLRSVASAARHETVTTSSLPTLGDDLVKQVTLHAGPGERTLTMRLLPESLGEVQVEVTSNAQTVSVRLVSADAQVREALQQHANGLREALLRDGRDANVEIGSQLANQLGQGNLAQGNDGWSGRHAAQQDAQDRARFAPQAFFLTEPQTASTSSSERRVPVHHGALNLLA